MLRGGRATCSINSREKTGWRCDIWTIRTDRSANIAGILSEGRNVIGMMPHPERAADPLVGGTDGLVILHSLVSAHEASQCSTATFSAAKS